MAGTVGAPTPWSSSARPATSPTRRSFPSLQGMVRRGNLYVPVIGVAKSGWTTEQLLERARASLKEHGGGVDEAAFAKLTVAAPVHRRRLRRPGDLRGAAQGARRGEAPDALPGDSSQPVRERSSSSSARPAARTGARVVIEKPFGHDFAIGARPQPDPPLRLSGIVGLPHRPLPRQGGRREPPLLPIRQYLPRADLEPQLRGLRADHDGRGVRRAGARQVLRRDRRDPRRHPEPSPPGRRISRHGAAELGRRGPGPRRAGQGVPRDPARSGPKTSCGASSAATERSPGSSPVRTVETFAAVRLEVDSWRWAGVPFFIRAGKCLPLTATEVMVDLKRPPLSRLSPDESNYFRFRLGPKISISLGARVKKPGSEMVSMPTELDRRRDATATTRSTPTSAS